MRNDITERFIINMYVRGMKISEIANTVNITPQEVTEIIEKSKREISKKTEKIGNEDSRRLNVQVRKVNSTSKIIKEGKEHNALQAAIFSVEQADGKAVQTQTVKSEHVSVIYDLSGGKGGEIPAEVLAQLEE